MTGALPGGNARAAPDEDKGPDPELRPLLDAWRRVGRDLIRAQRAEFDALLAASNLLFDIAQYHTGVIRLWVSSLLRRQESLLMHVPATNGDAPRL